MELATPVLSTLRPRVVRAVAVYRAQTPAVRWTLIGVTLAAVLGPMAFSAPAPAPAATAANPCAPAATAGSAAPVPAAAPETQRAEPSVIERVVQAVTPKPAATAAKPKAEPALPADLAAASKTMVGTKMLRERRNAAQKILRYKPADQVPSYLRVIAELETARGCKQRKSAIAQMHLHGDPRYLPTLRRYDRTSRNGCGFLGLSDCYDCIRGDVRDALDAIELAHPGVLEEAADGDGTN
jgi:hypothetical protein